MSPAGRAAGARTAVRSTELAYEHRLNSLAAVLRAANHPHVVLCKAITAEDVVLAAEADAYRNMLQRFARPGALLAVVSDSYDLEHAVNVLWGGELRQAVIDSGAAVVIRPDSGESSVIVLKTLQSLDAAYGSDVNAKGFKVLRHVRVSQGDGITCESIGRILETAARHGYSAGNVAFGQGGALLQIVNRDKQAFAMKCAAVQVAGQWRDVLKDPVTDRSAAQRVRGRAAARRRYVRAGQGARSLASAPDHEPTVRRLLFSRSWITC